MISREIVAQKLTAYLRHEIPQGELVDWAERTLMEAEFEEAGHDAIRDTVARLGLADVRAFGLTWEDTEALFHRLGYAAHIQIEAL